MNDLLDHSNAELSDRLSRIGDNIVVKLVQWTRRLPFYEDIPVNIHTSLLTNKWHELLVLTTSSYQAIHGGRRMGTMRSDGETAEHHQEVYKAVSISYLDIYHPATDIRRYKIPFTDFYLYSTVYLILKYFV